MFVVSEDGDTLRYSVDVDEIIRRVYAVEEEYFRKVVVIRMRELGYTVIAPR
jgi:hypothetical protein